MCSNYRLLWSYHWKTYFTEGMSPDMVEHNATKFWLASVHKDLFPLFQRVGMVGCLMWKIVASCTTFCQVMWYLQTKGLSLRKVWVCCVHALFSHEHIRSWYFKVAVWSMNTCGELLKLLRTSTGFYNLLFPLVWLHAGEDKLPNH